MTPMKPAGADAALLRRTRWRLAAWSGGTTLVVLLLLGTAIYVAVARTLETSAIDQLERRAFELQQALAESPTVGPQFQVSLTPDAGFPGIVFLGPTSGTLAFVIGPDEQALGVGSMADVLGLPYQVGVEIARGGQTDIATIQVARNAVRVLSVPVQGSDDVTYVVQVLSDREQEEQALRTVLAVLTLGGVLVMAAAVGVGYLYAGRALVPIRESLRRQREFAADASHELRNPLSVVRATVADLERRPDERIGDATADLQEIEAQTDRLTELIDELLLFARAESGAIELAHEQVDLSEAALAATNRLGRLAAQHEATIEAHLAPAEIRGDPRRLEQLAVILVDNAIRHSPEGGVVEVTSQVSGTTAQLVVEDRGPGISPDELDSIFDRFHRSETSRPGGVGLGLAIARWIADRHGGSVRAENRPGGGARFVVSLPLAAPSSPTVLSA
jgi:signal transduction histidine kinase